jgi:hypothetical protein
LGHPRGGCPDFTDGSRVFEISERSASCRARGGPDFKNKGAVLPQRNSLPVRNGRIPPQAAARSGGRKQVRAGYSTVGRRGIKD